MQTQTTVMRDSMVGDAWIQEACRQNPVQRVIDEKTGQPNGNILTGPVRLVFTDAVFEAKPKMKSDPNSKVGYQSGILFTPYTDMAIFWEEYYKIAASDFPSHWNAQAQQYYGLDNPFFDQGTKQKYNGFTAGLWASTFSSNFPPDVVDTRGNPITDHKAIYPGVWAIVACNAYASGKNAPRKGPRFGLVSIMKIADDKPLGGGAPDPRTLFKGVTVKPPVAVPQGAFGQAVRTGAPGTPPVGQAAVGQFYPTSAPAGAPPMAGAPMGAPPAGPGPADEDLSQFL